MIKIDCLLYSLLVVPVISSYYQTFQMSSVSSVSSDSSDCSDCPVCVIEAHNAFTTVLVGLEGRKNKQLSLAVYNKKTDPEMATDAKKAFCTLATNAIVDQKLKLVKKWQVDFPKRLIHFVVERVEPNLYKILFERTQANEDPC